MSHLEELRLEEEKTLAIRVRALCQLYFGSAEIVGTGKYSVDEEIREYEKQRYEKGRKEVLEIAIKLTDKFYRDAALHVALDYCMKAKDLHFATAIAKAITVDVIQEKIVKDHGEYFVLRRRPQTNAARRGPLG
jgi:hypothetical protein